MFSVKIRKEFVCHGQFPDRTVNSSLECLREPDIIRQTARYAGQIQSVVAYDTDDLTRTERGFVMESTQSEKSSPITQ